ncbi:MAG: flagellar basal body P-ring protein FlgI [Alphaproteobacteria bacterium]|nr:flagellar basal body P-ring protein FlgI [Alphaproteobacteria bacterium]MBQ8662172.1 flagellar basal body P-ring protein FlgI [Alphaproteobacteria bacterium]
MNTGSLKKLSAFLIAGCLLSAFYTAAPAYGVSRIKDIADFEGVRDNQLVGYGLVVGLNGTGDNIKSVDFTKESLISMLDQIGINARGGQIKAKNVAAVMVTANLPAFARQGSRIDVMVSAIGDAKNLQGGTLLATPLVGANGEVYALAQGQVAVNAVSARGATESVNKGVPTSGRIANGAIVENEIPFALNSLDSIQIALRNPDFTTSRRVADAINAQLGTNIANSIDPATITLEIPEEYADKVVDLMTKVEQIRVEPDQLAKVVIDENSGIIVIGKDVKINRLAIAQGNLTIRITEIPFVSQPLPFSNGETVVGVNTAIDINESVDSKLSVLETGVNLQELVNGLNALGVTPRDLISILQAVKASGALQADIEVI